MFSLLLATSAFAAPASVPLDPTGPPVGSEPASVAPSTATPHVLNATHALPPGVTAWIAGPLVNLRAGIGSDAAVAARLEVGTRVKVLDDVGDWVEVRVGAQTGWVAREWLSTMGRAADLDQDGVEERLVVAFWQGEPTLWLREAGVVQHLSLSGDNSNYLGEWAVVPASQAGIPLLRVALGQDACGGFPTRWLSYEEEQLRVALGVDEWVDGAAGGSAEVGFGGDGRVTVRTEAWDELGEVVSTAERACVLAEGVYVCPM